VILVLNNLLKGALPDWIYHKLIGRWDTEGLRRYTANTLWALVARVINIITSFFVTIYLVRYLGPENYGQLSYSLSFVGLFGIISTLGIDGVLYRDLVKYPEQRNTYLGTAFVVRVVAGIVAGIAATIVGFLANPDDVSRLVILLLSATFVFTSFAVIGNEFQAKVEQKYPALITLIVVFILNALKLVVVFTGEGIIYIAAILLLEPILYLALFAYVRVRNYGTFSDWKFDKGVARQLLIDAWPFIFIAMFMTLYSRIDQIMLKHMVDSTAVGIYDAALRIAEAWLFLPAIVVTSIFPAIVNAKQISTAEYRTRLLSITGAFVVLAVVIATLLSLVAKDLIVLFYGETFTASGAVLIIYMWVGVWAVIDIVMRNYLIIENMRKTIFFMTAAAAIINTGLNLVLIPAFGPAGAALSTFIAYSVFCWPLLKVYRLK
jgi:O-antigen/teichoic acid export membrane protein